LYKINLGVKLQQVNLLSSSQQYRGKRQSVIKDVKQAYYEILQLQSALQATNATIKQYEELDRLVLHYVALEEVLQSESLEVKAKLAEERYNAVKLRNNLATEKEQLNNLLGRDLETEFRVEEVPAALFAEIDLVSARQAALQQRPEIKQAELGVQKADLDRRLAKSDYIPDVGIALHYLSPFNVTVVPQNILSAGIELSWEPFDWGRRRDNVSQKKVVVEQSNYQLNEVRSNVIQEVNARFRKLDESRVLLEVAKAAQQAANQKLKEVTDKFKQESVLFRDVLQQQTAVANANHNYEQALLSFWNAKADFEKALGED
jgi:outer membrane protein TolC